MGAREEESRTSREQTGANLRQTGFGDLSRRCRSNTGTDRPDRSFGVTQRLCPPSVLGPSGRWSAPPDNLCQVANRLDLPSPPGSRRVRRGRGGRGKVVGGGRAGRGRDWPRCQRPSIFARTGSKSTNHDLNKARAIASSVSPHPPVQPRSCRPACRGYGRWRAVRGVPQAVGIADLVVHAPSPMYPLKVDPVACALKFIRCWLTASN